VTTVDLPVPQRALAIGAHPDDVEFGAAATLAKWAAAGCEVHLLVCTDGSKGTWDHGADPDEIATRREHEQREAAARLGVAGVRFLGRVDGELTHDVGTRAAVCEVLRSTRPDVVLGHDPWHTTRIHPDHRHAGLLTLEGIVTARDPHFHPEQGLAPHRPSAALLFETESVDHVEAVEGFVDDKLAALLCHRSQWRSTMGIDRDPEVETARFARTVRSRTAAAGGRVGRGSGEGFRLLRGL
jgi:LmbE family N-acetylglucosaminyl deacetylase